MTVAAILQNGHQQLLKLSYSIGLICNNGCILDPSKPENPKILTHSSVDFYEVIGYFITLLHYVVDQ